MPELSVVIVAFDSEQRAVLQVLVDGTSVARGVHSCPTYPVAATDPVVRRIQGANPEVILVDMPVDNAALALGGMEFLDQEMPDSAFFCVGCMLSHQVV